MTPKEYRELRARLGSQDQAAAVLDVNTATLDRRENGRGRIRREAEYAIRWAVMCELTVPTVRRVKAAPKKAVASKAAKKKARKASTFERTYHSRERVSFVASLPCVACGATPCENAHIVGGGMGRKADYQTIVPLCRKHHREQHRVGIKTFAEKYALDLWADARATEARWREEWI